MDKAMGDLPPLPTIVTKVLQITGDVNGNAADLERYVTMDQALSAKMLRVVNSPYFGISGQISSISHSIVILGFNQIRNLVLSVGAGAMFAVENERAQPIHLDFWRHSMATASCAAAIARLKKFQVKEQELVFVSSMIANVGALFLLKNMTLPYMQVYDRWTEHKGVPLSHFEVAVFGLHHAEVAEKLCAQWNLPDEIAEVLAKHEGPFDQDSKDVWMAIHLADRMAAMVSQGIEIRGEIANADSVALAWLNAEPAEIELMKAEAKIKLEDSNDMLDSLAA